MAYVPFAPEIGAKYTLVAGDGTTCVFNDPADANYVGMLSDVTGLDSPDVRESGDILSQTDGGWHGNFYFGRRPITLSGSVPNIVDAADRAVKLDRLRQASLAMRQDATLSWLNNAAGAVQMRTWVRRQQPFRISGAWVKTFQLLLVSQFAPLFSDASHTSATGTSLTIENKGNYASFPVITVYGGTTGAGVVVTNTTTGAVVNLSSALVLSPTGPQSVAIDTLNHTAIRNDGTVLNQYIDFVGSTWPALIKGNNTYTVTGAANMSITWRDAWM